MRCETLDDVVNGDIGGAADDDALVEADELEDELYECVCFAGLMRISLWPSIGFLVELSYTRWSMD